MSVSAASNWSCVEARTPVDSASPVMERLQAVSRGVYRYLAKR